jgi:hypothetical protein
MFDNILAVGTPEAVESTKVSSSFWSSAANVTATWFPSPKDLVLAVPRMVMKAGSFAFVTVPESMDSVFGLGFGRSAIAEATGESVQNVVTAAASRAVHASVEAVDAAANRGGRGTGVRSGLSLESVRSFGHVFSYATSKWAVWCIIMVCIGDGLVSFLLHG